MDNSLVDNDHFQFLFVNIYASNNKHLNTTLFPSVENKISQLQTTFPSAKVLWRGDFNTAMNGSMDRWPPKDTQTNELENVCDRRSLIDIWRHGHSNERAYTWSNKDKSLQPQRHFWLISSNIKDKVDSVTIEPTVLTDRKAVTVRMNMGASRQLLQRWPEIKQKSVTK